MTRRHEHAVREWPQAYTVMGVIGSIAAPIIVALLGSTLSAPPDPGMPTTSEQGRDTPEEPKRDAPPTAPEPLEDEAPVADDEPEPETATDTDTDTDTDTGTEADTDTDTGTGTGTQATPPSGGTYPPPGTGQAFAPPGTESVYDEEPGDLKSRVKPPPTAAPPPSPPKGPPPSKFTPGGI